MIENSILPNTLKLNYMTGYIVSTFIIRANMLLTLREKQVKLTKKMISRSDLLKALADCKEEYTASQEAKKHQQRRQQQQQQLKKASLDVDEKMFDMAIMPVLKGDYYFNVLETMRKSGADAKRLKEAYQLMLYFAFPKRGKLPNMSTMVTRMANVGDVLAKDHKKLGNWCDEHFSKCISKMYPDNNLCANILLGESFKWIYPIRLYAFVEQTPIYCFIYGGIDRDRLIRVRSEICHSIGITFDKLKVIIATCDFEYLVKKGLLSDFKKSNEFKLTSAFSDNMELVYDFYKGSNKVEIAEIDKKYYHITRYEHEYKKKEDEYDMDARVNVTNAELIFIQYSNYNILKFEYKDAKFVVILTDSDDNGEFELPGVEWGMIKSRRGISFVDDTVNPFTREITFKLRDKTESELQQLIELAENGFTVKFDEASE